MLPFFAPLVVWYMAPEWVEDPAYRGHGGIRRLDAIWAANFDDWAWEVQEIRDLQERVLVLAEQTGRIKISGAPIRQPIGIVASDFRNDTIGTVRTFLSWGQALEAARVSE